MSTAADDLSPELGAFLDLVYALGGPKIQAEDIEWAADLPAGQSLIKWIASQVLVGRDGGSAENTVEYIALETEEIKMHVDDLIHFLRVSLIRVTSAWTELGN
jgi:hypothetical protein